MGMIIMISIVLGFFSLSKIKSNIKEQKNIPYAIVQLVKVTKITNCMSY